MGSFNDDFIINLSPSERAKLTTDQIMGAVKDYVPVVMYNACYDHVYNLALSTGSVLIHKIKE